MSSQLSCPFHTSAPSASGCPVSAATFDPFSDGYQQDPALYLKWARQEQPIFYSPQLGYWVVTRYEDVRAIFRDNVAFSPSIALEKITPTGKEAEQVLASYNYGMARTLVNEDEPAHMARRRLLIEPFTPPALKHHEDLVRKLTREYIDSFIDEGRIDLVDGMLWELTLTVALHFLGVPEEDMPTLRKYSIAHTVNTWGRPKPEEQVAVAHAVGNFWKFAGQVLDKMRKDPSGDGWMKFGIRLQPAFPDVITDSYLHSMMMAGIVAAHETTANAAANALKLLLQDRRAWDELVQEPSLIPNAVEECLRLNGSVAAWRRLVTQDAEVGGVKLPQGSKLLMVMASANHDDEKFPDGDTIDLRRENAVEHLTFGYGSHQCMGKNLARMELQIFLSEFTRRLPHMRLAEQKITYLPNTSFRGPEHLWVEWDPAVNPERTDPGVVDRPVVVSIGESPTKNTWRVVEVVQSSVDCEGGILQLQLSAPSGHLPLWEPGAHIDIECGAAGPVRSYSLCGDPADAYYQIAIKRETPSRGGSDWLHENARPGLRLRMKGPKNHFRFAEDGRPVMLLAAGIGITPISAMARRANQLGMPYELHYCGQRRGKMPLLTGLQEVHGPRLFCHVSEEGSRADLVALCEQKRAAIPGLQIYACGPERFLNELESLAESWPRGTLQFEHFSSLKRSAENDTGFEVQLQVSGLKLDIPPGVTLLHALRNANVEVSSDCEEGLCGTCEVRVVSGQIEHRDVVLTHAEREAGDRMLSCCSRGIGRIVLDL
jgi:cytochrome P450/ferredoxin-NADP reductase